MSTALPLAPAHLVETVCPLDCPDSCSLDVTLQDGRITNIDGSSLNPITNGYICAKVRRFAERVYGVDRLLYPSVRKGPKGFGRFERVSWEEALSLIATRLLEARERWGGESILPYSYGGSNGLLTQDTSDATLFRRLGTSRLARTVCAAPTGAANEALYGKMPSVTYEDYVHARLIIVWGCNPSASGIHLVPYIREAQRAGAALVVIDPNNPTGATYSAEARRALVDLSYQHNFPLLADEVYADLAFDGPVPAIAALNPDAPVITFSSLSKAYLAPGWRAGWLAVALTDRLDDVLAGIKKLADGRLCSTGPMEHALAAALTGDRSHQQAFRDALRERAHVTFERMNAIDGITCVAPTAAFYAMPRVALPPGKTDEDFVLGLLRATGVLCVYGSGFATAPGDGYFRVVFLASPSELREIYQLIADFTGEFLASRAR